MAVERSDLSVNLSVDRMAPVSSSLAVRGQSAPRNGEGKPRRRPPPAAKASEELAEEDGDRPEHRIDSLA
jgi:hypothetical protein